MRVSQKVFGTLVFVVRHVVYFDTSHINVYRISIATQNVAYNQPTQPGFYIGPELKGTFRGYTFK